MIEPQDFAGADSSQWAGDFPAEEWASEILEAGVQKAILLNKTRQFRGERKRHIPKRVPLDSVNWTTGAGNEPSATDYDADTITLDPVRHRAYIPLDIDSIKENTYDVVADVKKNIRDAVQAKIETLIYGTFTAADYTGLTNYVESNESGGSTGTIEDGDILTTDLIKHAVRTVKEQGDADVGPDTMWLPPSAWEVFMGDKQFYNAASWGDDTPNKEGKIAYWQGCDIYISNRVPTFDSDNAKFSVTGYEGAIFRSNAWLATLLSETMELRPERKEKPYQMHFNFNFKMDEKVADWDYGTVIVAEDAA